MFWIKVIDYNEATGKLKEIYEELIKKRGKISNIMKVQSLNPTFMKLHMDLYINLMFQQAGLTREERELIAVVVSSANGCQYCTNHHAEALNHYWKDKDKLQKVIKDYKSIELPDKIIKMLNYAYKLTKNPNEIKQKDIDDLRKSGFSDEDILNINLIVSYFNLVNRIASGLGVEFTTEEVRGYKV